MANPVKLMVSLNLDWLKRLNSDSDLGWRAKGRVGPCFGWWQRDSARGGKDSLAMCCHALLVVWYITDTSHFSPSFTKIRWCLKLMSASSSTWKLLGWRNDRIHGIHSFFQDISNRFSDFFFDFSFGVLPLRWCWNKESFGDANVEAIFCFGFGVCFLAEDIWGLKHWNWSDATLIIHDCMWQHVIYIYAYCALMVYDGHMYTNIQTRRNIGIYFIFMTCNICKHTYTYLSNDSDIMWPHPIMT